MALGELPRAPAFLIGQVGDQRIAFHGTSGQFYLTHENLGENNGKPDSESENGSSVEFRASGVSGDCGENFKEVLQNGEIKSEYEVTTHTGEGVMESGDIRGACDSSKESANDNGVLMGRLSKLEATKTLELKHLRFWQLTQQAIAGMTVGLLTQPRCKVTDLINSDQQEIKQLKAKILELEKIISTQTKLVEILKSMPGCQGVTLKDEKAAIPRGVQKKGRIKFNNSAKRDSEINSEFAGSKLSDLRSWKKDHRKAYNKRGRKKLEVTLLEVFAITREWLRQGRPGSRPVIYALPQLRIKVVRSVIAELKHRYKKRYEKIKVQERKTMRA